jgi:hypothetical protein
MEGSTMSGRIYHCTNGTEEYDLFCDACGTAFQCNDDSFLSWPVLCAAAEAEGWTADPDSDGEHQCAECAASAAPGNDRDLVAIAGE